MATRKGAKTGKPSTAAKRTKGKKSDKPKKSLTSDTASKGKGTKPITQKSNKQVIIPTMPSVIMGTQPTGKQLTGEENMPGVEVEEEDRRNRPLSEATVERLGKSELRAIATSRGYWKSNEPEHRSGSRLTRAAFLEAQKKDKSLTGSEV